METIIGFLTQFLDSAAKAGQFSGASVWAFFAILQALYLLYDRHQQRKAMDKASEISLKRVESDILLSNSLVDSLKRIEQEIRFKLEAINVTEVKKINNEKV